MATREHAEAVADTGAGVQAGSDAAFEAEQARRVAKLKRQLSLLSRVYGIAGITADIGNQEKNRCRLTRDGIIISVNPEALERLATRQWYGAQGSLSLRIADFMVLTHLVLLASDYLDPTYCRDAFESNRHLTQPNQFFANSIDGIVADASLRMIPSLAPFFPAYISRQISHDIEAAPLHVQFLTALKLYLLEPSPRIKMASTIEALFAEDAHGFIQRMSDELLEKRLPYEARHETAKTILGDMFLKLLYHDLRLYSLFQFMSSYDQFSYCGEVEDEDADGSGNMMTRDVQQRAQQLYTLMSGQDIDKMIEDRYDSSDSESKDGIGSTLLTLPRTLSQTDEPLVSAESEEGYASTVSRWFDIIQQVADVFIDLASPTESITVPRYAPRKAFEGVRLSPQAVPEAMTQIETGRMQAIWQPVVKVLRTQDLQFSGLDVFLTLDVSGSMQGQNAEYASAMGICMLEGLALARHRAETDAKQRNVDVRVQLLAFGSGWAELTPLCTDPSLAQKETALYNLMHPESDHTMVNGALKHVKESATLFPERDTICIVVSDGLFADGLMAFKTVQAMPGNCFVGHINIGEFGGIPITPDYEILESPVMLPARLKSILSAYLARNRQ